MFIPISFKACFAKSVPKGMLFLSTKVKG